MQTPEARPRTVFVDAFHVPVALPLPLGGTRDVGKEGFGGRVTVNHTILAALFVVKHELHRHLRPVRPFRIGRVGAVALHVAGVTGGIGRHRRYRFYFAEGKGSRLSL